jgi:diguanylate cyclase (GGDEF)-like protein
MLESNGNGKDHEPSSGHDADARSALAGDHAATGSDQSAADADQTGQDQDQTGSDRDEAASESDQTASNRDQGAADRDHATDRTPTSTATAEYNKSRDERDAGTHTRLLNQVERQATASDRLVTAVERDVTAAARDDSARRRDARAEAIDRSIEVSDASLADQLQLLRAQAAEDRARAAADRERAARDREQAAAERARLEASLGSAHLDDLTGAYRRAMGTLTISNEIERARRSDGRFILAFVDVDDMKGTNDRHGHAAGDLVLKALVRIMRSKLRPFDPIIRYGGDEFLCGMGSIDFGDAQQRFHEIDAALQAEVDVGISFGLATLAEGETADQLTARADALLLEAKASHSPTHAT